jgi:uncharacterized membrane protein YdjX (TVP38/TMEM64 family)
VEIRQTRFFVSKGASNKKTLLLLGAAAVLLSALGISAGGLDWLDRLKEGLDRNLPYGLFLGLMAVLPVLGFPISAFLILGGVRFGIGLGLLAMAVTFPFHLLAVYLITHSLLRRRLESFLNRYDYRMPRIPPNRAVLYTSLLVGIPSLPYAVKNYLLALGGVPGRLYFALALPIHLIVGVPFVILGKSMISLNVALSLLVVGIIVVGNLVMNRIRKSMEGPDGTGQVPDPETDGKVEDV